ncbi:MAG: molecular chaperone DnaJ [Acidimicrobiales bacterium]|nr:molecular chaperone DnaJ [Acidimicrobiales bacterium]
MTGSTDYYEILGVGKNASDDEIKRAYRKLAREHHPDANDGDATAEAKFKEISAAYETLKDPERRRRYDMFGDSGDGGPQGFDMGGFTGGFSDLFDAFLGGNPFGQRGRRQGPPRGQDMEIVVDLSFKDAVFGQKQSIKTHAPERCETCKGSGAKEGTSPQTCSACKGAGEIRQVRQSLLGQIVTSGPCGTCQGLGQVISSPCPDCGGEGRQRGSQEFTIEIPAGVDNGTTLRLSNRGAPGPRGGANGDLYVHLRVKSDPRFIRDGNDLIHEMHIPMTGAALGMQMTFESLDGEENINVQPGTQSGAVVRIKGKGVPQVRTTRRGDLLVHIIVDTPTKLSKEQERLLKELAKERGEETTEIDHGLISKLRRH